MTNSTGRDGAGAAWLRWLALVAAASLLGYFGRAMLVGGPGEEDAIERVAWGEGSASSRSAGRLRSGVGGECRPVVDAPTEPGPSAPTQSPSPLVDPLRAAQYSRLAIDTGWADELDPPPELGAPREVVLRYVEDHRMDYMRGSHDYLVRALVNLEDLRPGSWRYNMELANLATESAKLILQLQNRNTPLINEGVNLNTDDPSTHRFVSGNYWYEVHVDEFPEFFALNTMEAMVPNEEGIPTWAPVSPQTVELMHYRSQQAIESFLAEWEAQLPSGG
ncbi:MAG: hypothetical protein QGI46_08805 [Planctomycetota bacterium]|nr:hypothetical protein [Planctomycetota bacterium]